MTVSNVLNDAFIQIWRICHHLLTLMLFQTWICINLFLLSNTIWKINKWTSCSFPCNYNAYYGTIGYMALWTAERIIGTPLPILLELYLSRVSKMAGKITLDLSHPEHSLFELLPSGRLDATELWAQERPDTDTVSFLRQSISWTLDNNYGAHTIYILIHLFI